MKRYLLILVGALVGLAQAQSVDLAKAWDACPSEKAVFDRAAQGTGYTWRDNRDYAGKDIGQPVTADRLQRKLEEAKSMLRTDSGSYGQASWGLTICGLTAALQQLQVTPVASVPPASSPGTQQSAQASVRGCMKQHSANATFRNECSVRVNLTWCAVPLGSTPSVRYPCLSQRFVAAELLPGDSVTVDEGAMIAWFACPVPRRPGDLEYVHGTGLMGRCLRQ